MVGFFSDDKSFERDFEEIYRTYEKKIYNTAYKTAQNPHDASDITQEVFISVAKNLRSFKGESSLSTWIFRITVNKCIDYGRRKQKSVKMLIDEDIGEGENLRTIKTQSIDDSPEEHLKKQELRHEIASALAELSEDHREVILLRDVNGLSYEEIAQVTQLPEGTVKSRISRARDSLREILRRDGNFLKANESNQAKGVF